jgi:predicted amidohydrolase
MNGIDKATQRLSEIARTQGVFTLMSNCIGHADGSICAGKTAAWNTQGVLLAQLDESSEGILLLDTETTGCTLQTL